MTTLTRHDAALELLDALKSGILFTDWAKARCGQDVTARCEQRNPPVLWAYEAADLAMTRDETWACLRRAGPLTQADGTPIGEVTAAIAIARVTPALITTLTTTDTPLGTALGPEGSGQVLESAATIAGGFAAWFRRLIYHGPRPVAVTTERVYAAWLYAGSTWG